MSFYLFISDSVSAYLLHISNLNLLQICWTSVSHLLIISHLLNLITFDHICYTSVSDDIWEDRKRVTHLLHICWTSVSHLLNLITFDHICYTSVSDHIWEDRKRVTHLLNISHLLNMSSHLLNLITFDHICYTSVKFDHIWSLSVTHRSQMTLDRTCDTSVTHLLNICLTSVTHLITICYTSVSVMIFEKIENVWHICWT